MKILTAKYVLPIISEPLIDAAVAVDGDKIIEVGNVELLQNKFPEAKVDDFGEAAILPGFVNCHSHLEITAMRGTLDAVENDFYTWLITLTKLRGEILDEDDLETAAIAGALEGARAGVTCFGDIGRFGGAGFAALKTVGLRGLLYQETDFAADGRTANEDFERLKEKFLSLYSEQNDLVEVGISPHAPYTVSRELFEKIARFGVDENIKITIHAAESPEEDELMRSGSGFFTTVYEKFGIEWTSPLCSSIEYLSQTGILETRPLLAHCITVTDQDIETIAESGSSIAHCPKSNAKFGHGYAPFERLCDAGITVGLGSDSVSSNNTCDMLEEARFAAFAARNRADRKRFIKASEVFEAATIRGAKALGLNDKIGSLEQGKQADLMVVNLSNIAQQPITNIEAALVFSSNARDVEMTMVAGREIYRNGKSQTVDENRLHARLREIGNKITANRTPSSTVG
ncbi:MAG TPA: amidohydrolase family protein [Pyrinomonadaceae bacterium]|nr:amidohydrolase family protein [Pyrinomonadaceae bacterium]